MALTDSSPFPAADAPAPHPGPLHHLKLLFWLKWTMTLRTMTRSKSAIVGIIFAALVFVPFALGIAVGFGWVFVRFGQEQPFIAEQTLRAVLMGIYIMWLFAPLAGFALNDSYDITKLFVYPVSVRRIFSGAILGSLLDLTTLLLLPTLLAILWGFGHASVFAFLIALLALPLFLFQTLALSQAVLLASVGILRSRKFRDIALVVVPTFWIGYQLFNHFYLQQAFKSARVVQWKQILQSPGWEAANLLPPGLCARAIASGSQNHFLPAVGFLLALALVTAATVYFSSWIVQKAYDGDEVSPRASAANLPAVTASPAPAGQTPEAVRRVTLAGFTLPAVVGAVFDKEIKYYLREPYYRVVLMNFAYLTLMGLFFSFGRKGGQSQVASFLPGLPVWFASGLIMMRQSLLFNNMFGADGAAASTLLLFPAPRRQILIGKNLPLLLAGAVSNTLLVSLLALFTKQAGVLVAVLPWVLLSLPVMASVGNLFSIYYPSPVVMKGFRARGQAFSAASSQGLGASLIYLAVSLGTLFLYVPLLAALAVPFYFVGKLWLLVTVPVAALYAGGLYLLSLHLGEPALLAQETVIMAKVYRATDG